MADTYLSPEDFRAFVASLPRRRLAAGALITDPNGSVLVAKPNYKDGWTLPGGTVEAGEAPQDLHSVRGVALFRRVPEHYTELPADDLDENSLGR